MVLFKELLGLIGGDTEEMPIEGSAAGPVKSLFSSGGKLLGALGRNGGRGGRE